MFATDRTGNGDIYVIDAHGHNNVRLTHAAASDIDPSWQPRCRSRFDPVDLVEDPVADLIAGVPRLLLR
jgi:hypothetical protein